MNSQTNATELVSFLQVKKFAFDKWSNLSDRQKSYVKKIWGVMTYKWRWQIALNVPYLVIFILDRTVPSVHKFDMALLASVTSKLPLPDFVTAFIGI